MDKNIFRIGKVSSIDYENGMLQVVYTDKDNAVTAKLPYANFGNEYNMPGIGEQVMVAHLSNGTGRGVVLGSMWNKKNLPRENGKELYRKELSKVPGAAYLRFNEKNGEYLIRAPAVLLHGVDHTDLEGPEVNIAANIRTRFESPEHEIALGSAHIMGLESEEIPVQVDSNVKIVMEPADLEALIRNVRLEILEELKLAAGTNFIVTAEENMSMTAGKEFCFENSKFSATLTEIMERLEALDGDASARKKG